MRNPGLYLLFEHGLGEASGLEDFVVEALYIEPVTQSYPSALEQSGCVNWLEIPLNKDHARLVLSIKDNEVG